MSRLKDLWFRIRALLSSNRMDQEFSEEMKFHLDMEVAHLVRQGMSPTEALRKAKIALGGVDQYREKAREARGVQPIEDLLRDVRYGVRTLRKSPLFTGVILFVLMLGIGSSTAIFSIVDGVLFQSLPYPNEETIVRVFSTDPDDQRGSFSGADFLDLQSQSQLFQQLAGYSIKNFNLIQDAGPQRLRGAAVTPDFFEVFGVAASLGRAFSRATEGPGRPPVVVLSHGLWQTAFGSDGQVLGEAIELNDRLYEIVGVMPRGFDYPEISLWTSSVYAAPDPIFDTGEDPGFDRGAEYIKVVGNLRGDVSIAESRSELEIFSDRLLRDYPDTHEGQGISVVALREVVTESIRPTLNVLLAAVGVLLLIACGNVANLLLARASGREQEMALRRALGAGRRRLISQLLTESTLLAGAGGVLGAFAAIWGMRGLLSLAPEGIPRLDEVGVDFRLGIFVVLVSLGAGVVAGLLPTIRGSKGDGRGGGLLHGTRQIGSRKRSRARRGLVIAEVAFSLVLVVGAGLMVRTLAALNRVDPGFQPDRTFAAHLSLPETKYASEEEISEFVRQVEERTRSHPGVQAAGMVLSLPIQRALSGSFFFSIEGRAFPVEDEPYSGYQIATPGYFETLGVPLLEGRLFTDSEGALDPWVVVVNEALAQRFWPEEQAIGKRVTWDDPEGEEVEWSTIVGIVANSLQDGLDQEPRPEIFRLYSQAPVSYMTLVARGEPGARGVAAAMRGSILEVDDRVPLYGMASMDQLLSDSLGRRRFAMTLLLSFAGVALLLSAVGLYGVIRYGVVQRSREIGIRVALGAPAKGIVRGVLGEGVLLTLAGLGVGLGLALLASRLMSSLLFHVKTSDPTTFLVGGGILLFVSLAACGPPALKAARTDPLEVLREE
jgi:predicted permease